MSARHVDPQHPDSDASTAPLQLFFTAFAPEGFTYQPTASAHTNFARLCKRAGWTGNTIARSEAREHFKDALVQQFNFIYGVDGNDLVAWHHLCEVIRIVPAPDTVEECRKRVWDAHVNIIDLIEAVRTGRHVKRFDTVEQLATYTKKTGKFFPKENAYSGGLLKELLREIVNPYFGKRRNGSQKRKARKARRRAAAVASS